jgi:serine/threonine protein kinase
MTKVVDNFALIEVIGSGQYGKVYRGKHVKTGENFAVKCIGLDKYRRVPKLDEFTNNEIKVLTKLVHPNIVRFYDRLKTANNIYMIYEFCNGGTLENLIYKTELSQNKVMEYFDQLVEGFKAIAKENILHRDIKPSNILVHNGNIIKIADFGFCKSLYGESEMSKTMVGSPIYMSPELLKGMEYSQKADVWSLGVMLYEMLFKCCPFEEKNIPNLINLIERQELRFPKPIPDNIKSLLRGMLAKNPYNRWSWVDLFKYYDDHFPKHQQPMPLNNIINVYPNQNQHPLQSNPAPLPVIVSSPYNPQPLPQLPQNVHIQQQPPIIIQQQPVMQKQTAPANIVYKQEGFTSEAAQVKKRPSSDRLPMYISRLMDSNYRSAFTEFETLLPHEEDFTDLDDILFERMKMNNLLFSMVKINKFGFLDEGRIRDIFLVIMKKARQHSLNIKIKMSSITQESLQQQLIEVESFKASIAKDTEGYNNSYISFMDECEKHINAEMQITENQTNPKMLALKQQIEQTFEFDEHFFRSTILENAKVLLEGVRNEHLSNPYAQTRTFQLINYILDCALLDEQIRVFFNSSKRPQDQKYYEIVERLHIQDLLALINSKYEYLLNLR